MLELDGNRVQISNGANPAEGRSLGTFDGSTDLDTFFGPIGIM